MQCLSRFRFWWLSLALLLNACTAVDVREAGAPDQQIYLDRANRIAAFEQWGLVGRLSLDDGEDGGSGKLRWEVRSTASDLDFHGAMGRGAWQLQVRPDGAMLREADGHVQVATDVNSLMQDRVGWSVPVDALAWWVRGLRAPGIIEFEEFDTDGRLLSLRQFGWAVDFKRYRSVDDMALPVRLEAQRDSHRVKLAIGSWRLGPDEG